MNLICQKCSVEYTKPQNYKQMSESDEPTLKFFYTRQLTYCDPCRREREAEMLESALPKIIDALSKI